MKKFLIILLVFCGFAVAERIGPVGTAAGSQKPIENLAQADIGVEAAYEQLAA